MRTEAGELQAAVIHAGHKFITLQVEDLKAERGGVLNDTPRPAVVAGEVFTVRQPNAGNVHAVHETAILANDPRDGPAPVATGCIYEQISAFIFLRLLQYLIP